MLRSSIFGISVQGILATFVIALVALLQSYILNTTWLQTENKGYITSISDMYDKFDFQRKMRTLLILGEMVGSLSSFIFSDRLGRRSVMIVSTISCLLSLTFSLLAYRFSTQVGTRFVTGISLGCLLSVAPNYLAEIVQHDFRGRIFVMYSLFMIIGSLLATNLCNYESSHNIFGGYISTMGAIIICLFILIGMTIVPESPPWLSVHATRTDVLRALRSIRMPQEYKIEFTRINTITSMTSFGGHPCSWFQMLTDESILYRLGISIGLQFIAQISGSFILSGYGIQFLDKFAVHDHNMVLILASITSAIGCFISYKFIDKLGRRFLLVFGSFSMAVSWVGAIICESYGNIEHGLADINPTSMRMQFLFLGFFCLFAFCYSSSVGTLIWVIPAEIFPVQCRAKAMSIIYSFYNISFIVSSHLFLDDGSGEEKLNVTTILVICFCWSILLGVGGFFLVPETANIPLEGMGSLFSHDPNTNQELICRPYVSFEKKYTRNKRPSSENTSTSAAGQIHILDSDAIHEAGECNGSDSGTELAPNEASPLLTCHV